MDDKSKVAPIVTKEYPDTHLNAGIHNTKKPEYKTEKTSDILGAKTQWPKPITDDKAWKAK